MNRFQCIGRLTRDPESRTFASGAKVTQFGLAVNEKRKDAQTGLWEDFPLFLDCKAWNRGKYLLADYIEERQRKGQEVFIEGKLEKESWEKDGQKRERLVVVVETCKQFAGRERAEAAQPDQPAAVDIPF